MSDQAPPKEVPPQTKEDEEAEGGEAGPEGLSKKAAKKLAKQAEKDARKAATQANQPQAKEEDDPLKDNYGEVELIQSQTRTNRVWTKVGDINESLVGKTILVRARLHNSRGKGNLVFIVLRDQCHTAQCVAFPNESVSKKMIKWISGISKESIVDVEAEVTKPEQEIVSCSQKQELKILKLHVVSRSAPQLPFQLEDAQRRLEKGESETEGDYDNAPKAETQAAGTEEQKEGDKAPVVRLKTRLDNRIIDLRTTTNQAIFRVSSGVCQLFREFLLQNRFVEIHTPKLIAGTSEGGANVFKLKYFDKEGCLAQSPQLYKQMCVMSDFDRVFEIGPVFRAEKSFTHRHMCEFTGLDIEMAINEHYFELLDFMGELFAFIFNGLQTRFATELATISEQYPFEPFKCKTPVVRITFEEGIQLLKSRGIEWNPLEDLDTPTERKLGAIVREVYDTDFYMLHRYPTSARPFYTMICKDDDRYTNSYDFFMRGEEITSGAQRIHDPEFLATRAKACGIDVATIQDYIDAFKYGAVPHGGCGVGLERVVMLYCNLGDIRKSCLFPRDPKRLTP